VLALLLGSIKVVSCLRSCEVLKVSAVPGGRGFAIEKRITCEGMGAIILLSILLIPTIRLASFSLNITLPFSIIKP
jgi:hypothetical protein